jgi:hypothetical protein
MAADVVSVRELDLTDVGRPGYVGLVEFTALRCPLLIVMTGGPDGRAVT